MQYSEFQGESSSRINDTETVAAERPADRLAVAVLEDYLADEDGGPFDRRERAKLAMGLIGEIETPHARNRTGADEKGGPRPRPSRPENIPPDSGAVARTPG